METQPMITTAARLPLTNYHRVVELAQDRRLVTGTERLNVSAALHELVALTLDTNPQQQQEDQSDA